jgi:hypothetical protein
MISQEESPDICRGQVFSIHLQVNIAVRTANVPPGARIPRRSPPSSADVPTPRIPPLKPGARIPRRSPPSPADVATPRIPPLKPRRTHPDVSTVTG